MRYIINISMEVGKVTNFERIKNMTVEELAYMLDNIDDTLCAMCNPKYCKGYIDDIHCPAENRREHCHNATVNYLKSEVEE